MADKPTLYIPAEGDFREEEPDAADAALGSLDDELRSIEGLRVTVSKIVGAPNDPMARCFTQPASNFQNGLDDLYEYVQREFGQGQYRAFYKKGGRIIRNILLTVAERQHKEPLVSPVPSTVNGAGNGEVKELINYLRERDARDLEERRRQQPAPALDPFAMLDRVVTVAKTMMPAQQPASGSALDGLETFMRMKELMREDSANAGPRDDSGPSWIPALVDGLKAIVPVVGGAMAGLAARRQAIPAAPVPSLPQPMEVSDMPSLSPEVQAYANQLMPLKPQLLQLDQAATFKADPAAVATSVLDGTPPAQWPIMAGIAAPANRQTVLAALAALVPGSEARAEWYGKFLDAVHEELTPEAEGSTLATGG